MSSRLTYPLCAISIATDLHPVDCTLFDFDFVPIEFESGILVMCAAANNVAHEPANGSNIAGFERRCIWAMLQRVKEAIGQSGVVVMHILVLGA